MNRFLSTTALALMLGAAPALAQSPETPSAPPQEPNMQAPMQPESPSAIPSEPDMKAPDQSSEAPQVITPDKSAEGIGAKATGQFLSEQKNDDMLASTIIGKSAYNSQDESIGEVNDLVTDRSGKILAALIGVGGFLGIGEKNVGVPFNALDFRTVDPAERRTDKSAEEKAERKKESAEARFDSEHENVHIVLNTSKDDLEAAPEFAWLDQQSSDRAQGERERSVQ